MKKMNILTLAKQVAYQLHPCTLAQRAKTQKNELGSGEHIGFATVIFVAAGIGMVLIAVFMPQIETLIKSLATSVTDMFKTVAP